MSDILSNIDAALEGREVPPAIEWSTPRGAGMITVPRELVTIGVAKYGNLWGVCGLESTDHPLSEATFKTATLARAAVESQIDSIADAIAATNTDVPADDFDAGFVPGTFDESGEFTPEGDAGGLVVEDLPFADPTVMEASEVPSVPAPTVPAPVSNVPAVDPTLAVLLAKVAEMEAAQAELRAENERLRTQQTPAAFGGDSTRAAIIDDAMSSRGADGVGTHPETNPAASTTPEVEAFFPPAFAAEVPASTYDMFAGETDPVKARRDRARKLGREVYREVRSLFETYIVFPSELSDAYAGTLALWCLHTHTYYYQRVTPYILLTSPTAGAGKSTVERIAGRVTAHAIELVGPSVAAVRMLASDGHTLILDEVDELYQGKDFKSILNAGYKHGATVPRVKGKTVMMDKVFSPKMLAGIAREGNPVEGALLDRCIQIDLQRAAHGEVPFFDPQSVSEALREKITEWARLIVGDLERHPSNMPALDSPRAAELWNPLVAVADAIGADYGENARTWAEEITGRREVQADPNIQILSDTRDVLLEWIQANPQATHIETAVLCELRNRYQGRVFVDALTGVAYGRRLARFGIKSASIDKVRQYRVADGRGGLNENIAAVFSRYCD